MERAEEERDEIWGWEENEAEVEREREHVAAEDVEGDDADVIENG
jgi:hypothetical protein